MNSIPEIIKYMTKKYELESLDISKPRELIFMLLASITGKSVNDLKLFKDDLPSFVVDILDNELYKVAKEKIPPQYITKKVNIYNEQYIVNEHVLIPRQDSETIIEYSINEINKNKYTSLLDMCSGSGVCGISIAKNSNIQNVTLLDISKDAMLVANENIKLNNAENKCSTIVSDMFSKLYILKPFYDIITANPPYLSLDEMKDISEFVKKEPSIALYGGVSGLDFYKTIYSEARTFLNNNGSVIVEIGYNQAEDVTAIIKEYKEYTDIQVIKDINQKNRVVICHFQKE